MWRTISAQRAFRTLGTHHLRCALRSFTVGTSCNAHTSHRLEDGVVTSSLSPVEAPPDTLHQLFFTKAASWPHRVATECGLTGRKYTFGELVDRSLRWAGVVSSLLLPTSPSSITRKKLTIYSTNSPEFPIIYLGGLAAGLTVTLINTNYTIEEVARLVADSSSDIIVTDPHLEDVMLGALKKLERSVPVFVNGPSSRGNPNLREVLEDSSRDFADPVQTPLKSTATILYSSGTTGLPKGVELSHAAFTTNLVNTTVPQICPYQTDSPEKQEAVVGMPPFYHVGGLFRALIIPLYMGGKVVTLPKFTPTDYVRVLEQHKVRNMITVPSLLHFLTTSPAVTPAALAHVRNILCGSAPVPPTAAEAFKSKVPNPVFFQEVYGMTEMLVVLITPRDGERLGWCGQCVPTVQAKVINPETGHVLPEGERGELYLKSPSMMTGYHNNPDATAKAIDADGWFHTGDIALFQEGYFSIVDRIKDIIKVKAFQVSPSEIEDLLLQHPGVVDAAVVGVADPRAGELPRAYIVRRDKGTTEEELHKFLEPRLANFKQLKGGIRFLDALPKLPTGKTLRRELKELAAKDP